MDMVGDPIFRNRWEIDQRVKIGSWIAAIGIGALMIALGGYREIVFVNINEQILFNAGQIDDYRVLDSFLWLKEYDTSALETFKWVLTIAFSIIFLILGFVIMRKIMHDAEGGLWLVITYAGAIFLAGSFYVTGRLIGQEELGYTLSRVFMGALQSPFILMLMIPARMLVKRM